jgi:hypothetical protein
MGMKGVGTFLVAGEVAIPLDPTDSKLEVKGAPELSEG